MFACFNSAYLSDFTFSCLSLCVCGFQRSGINSSDVEMLTLTNVTEDDAGEYICKVSNYIGEASQSGWLTVIPGNPWDLTPPTLPPPWCGFPGVCPQPAVVVLLVVSCWSWGSQTFFCPNIRPLCFSCWDWCSHGSTGRTCIPRHWNCHSEHLNLSSLTFFFLHLFLSCKLCQVGVCSAVLSMLSVFVCSCDQSNVWIRLASMSRLCWWRELSEFLFFVHWLSFLMFWRHTGLYLCLFI